MRTAANRVGTGWTVEVVTTSDCVMGSTHDMFWRCYEVAVTAVVVLFYSVTSAVLVGNTYAGFSRWGGRMSGVFREKRVRVCMRRGTGSLRWEIGMLNGELDGERASIGEEAVEVEESSTVQTFMVNLLSPLRPPTYSRPPTYLL